MDELQQASTNLTEKTERLRSGRQIITNAWNECERCGDDLPRTLGMTTLLGGYRTFLCAQCLNQWEEQSVKNPELIALNDIDLDFQMLIIRTQADGHDRSKEMKRLYRQRLEAQHAMFLAEQAWVHSGHADQSER